MMPSVATRSVCSFAKMWISIINHADVRGNLFVFNLVEGRIQACAGSDKNPQNNKVTLWDFRSLHAVIFFCTLINVRHNAN